MPTGNVNDGEVEGEGLHFLEKQEQEDQVKLEWPCRGERRI
jgi:hypothetical protein